VNIIEFVFLTNFQYFIFIIIYKPNNFGFNFFEMNDIMVKKVDDKQQVEQPFFGH
jgi:hypothetical protein